MKFDVELIFYSIVVLIKICIWKIQNFHFHRKIDSQLLDSPRKVKLKRKLVTPLWSFNGLRGLPSSPLFLPSPHQPRLVRRLAWGRSCSQLPSAYNDLIFSSVPSQGLPYRSRTVLVKLLCPRSAISWKSAKCQISTTIRYERSSKKL